MFEMAEDPLPSSSPRRKRARPDPATPETSTENLLARIAGPISRARELRRVAEVFLQELASSLPMTGWIAILDPASEQALWADGNEAPLPLRLARVPGSLLGNALNHAQPSVVHQLTALPEVPERPYLLRTQGAWAFLPVSVAGRSVACLILRAETPEILSPDALTEVRGALPVLGLALKAAQLQEGSDRADRGAQVTEISSLYEVSKSLGWVLTGDDLFRLLAGALEKSLPHDLLGVVISLPGERGCRVRAHGWATDTLIGAFHAEMIRELEESSGESASDLALRVERQAQQPGEAMFERLGATLHAPLHVRQRVVGILSLGARADAGWGAAGQRMLQTIASQASLTLDRLRSAQEAEKTRLGSMLESMADGVLLLDGDLRILMTNPSARAHLERIGCGPRPEMLARLGDVDLATLFAAFHEPAAASRTFEVSPERGIVFSVTCSPVRGAGESVEGMVVVLSDDSEARLMQAQVAQSEKLSALGKLVSGVAHELNNPLGTILGSAELLTTGPLEATAARRIDAIRQEAQRCRKVVEALLHFVKGSPPEKAPLDVHVAIDTVLRSLEEPLKGDRVEAVVERETDLPPVVGDRHLLQQVFYNIINNARHAVAEAARPGERRITIATRRSQDRVMVTIADTGPGIPEDCLTRIFDPFFSTKDVGKGTGLGLTLAYSTVRQHGGTLRAASKAGEGATFVIELPAAPAGTVVAGPEPVPAVAFAALSSAARERGAAGVRILVVEDEIPLAEVVAEALAACGYSVDLAHDGTAAKRRLGESRYDLIISDMKMPDISGRALHAHVLSQDPALARRVIFSTGDSANPETLAFFKEVGNPYLTKPFNLTQLLRAVEGVLSAS